MKYFIRKKKKDKLGVGSIFGLLLCLKQCSFPTKQHPDLERGPRKELVKRSTVIKREGCHALLGHPEHKATPPPASPPHPQHSKWPALRFTVPRRGFLLKET